MFVDHEERTHFLLLLWHFLPVCLLFVMLCRHFHLQNAQESCGCGLACSKATSENVGKAWRKTSVQAENVIKGTKNVSFIHGQLKHQAFNAWRSHVRKAGSHVTFRRVILHVHTYSMFDTLFPYFNMYSWVYLYQVVLSSQVLIGKDSHEYDIYHRHRFLSASWI